MVTKMTRIELAKKGIVTDDVKEVAFSEGVSPETLSIDIAKGITVIPKNSYHTIKPIGIGKGLRTKVNANIGTSKDKVSFDDEIEKLEVLVKYGADGVALISAILTSNDIRKTTEDFLRSLR